MFLEYLSLVILLLGLTMLFYAFVYLHDLPYDIAKKRNHPQVEAIHVACWVSLFTLHAIWPIVFIWAISKQRPMTVALAGQSDTAPNELAQNVARLEERLRALEMQSKSAS